MSFAVIIIGLSVVVLVGTLAVVKKYSRSEETVIPAANKLTRLVKRFLDFATVFVFIAAILWPITAIGVGMNLFFDPEARNVDVFLGFKVESEAATDPLIHGHSKVQVNTPSQFAWYFSAAVSEFLGLIVLYGLFQMRALFTSLTGGQPFAEENALRIKKIGFAVICWYAVTPFLQYFGGRAVLSDIALSAQSIQLYPAFELGVGGVFTGLAIIALSGVLREATKIHQEQELTI